MEGGRRPFLDASHLLKVPDLFCFRCFEKSAQSFRLSDWIRVGHAERWGLDLISILDWLVDERLRPLIGSRYILNLLSSSGGLSNSGVRIAHAWVGGLCGPRLRAGVHSCLKASSSSRQETDSSGHTREYPGSRNSVTASPRVQKSVLGVVFVSQVYFAITQAFKYNMSRCLLK